MIKVFFDNQIFSAQKFGGISRYFAELKARLPQSDVIVNHTKIFSENAYVRDKYPVPHFKVPLKSQLMRRANNAFDMADFVLHKYDIVHPTYYYPSNYFENVKSKMVVTVHDMIHEVFREEIAESDSVSEAKQRIVHRSDHIIAISNYTKKDLVKHFGISDEKISVVYHGWVSLSGKLKSIFLPDSYILYVGSRAGYKSFDKFVESAKETLLRNEVSVFCAGGGPFNADEKRLIQELGLSHLVFQKNVTDEELKYCYKNAKLFIFPSIYEGFGLPILEAFACQCPTLLFNGSCFPEIAEDSAHYFDSFDMLPAVLDKMLNDEKYRVQKSELQALRLQDFSWDRTARETSDIYRKIL